MNPRNRILAGAGALALAALTATAVVVDNPDGSGTAEIGGQTFALTDTDPLTVGEVAQEAATRASWDVAKLRPAVVADWLGYEDAQSLTSRRADTLAISANFERARRAVRRGRRTAAEAKAELEAFAATDAAQRAAVRRLLAPVKRRALDQLLDSGDGRILRTDMCLKFEVELPCSEPQLRQTTFAGLLCADLEDDTLATVTRTVTAGTDGRDLPSWARAITPSVREVDCTEAKGEFSFVRPDTTLAGHLTCTHPTEETVDVAPAPRDPVPRAINYERRGYSCECKPGLPCVVCPVSGGFVGRDPCVQRLARASE